MILGKLFALLNDLLFQNLRVVVLSDSQHSILENSFERPTEENRLRQFNLDLNSTNSDIITKLVKLLHSELIFGTKISEEIHCNSK